MPGVVVTGAAAGGSGGIAGAAGLLPGSGPGVPAQVRRTAGKGPGRGGYCSRRGTFQRGSGSTEGASRRWRAFPAGGVLTVAEFAGLSRLSRPTIYRGIDHGDINAIRIGGTIRIPDGEAVRLLGSLEPMVTVAELAEASRVSRPTIYRHIDGGSIGAVKICGTIRIPQSAATRLLAGPSGPSSALASAPGTERRLSPQAPPPSGEQDSGEPRAAPPFPAARFQPSPFTWSEDDDHG
jgi:excisionase family DNA binding protein